MSHPHTVPQSFDEGRVVWLGGHRHDKCWSALGAEEGRDYTSRNDVWTSDGLQALLDTNGIFIVFAKGTTTVLQYTSTTQVTSAEVHIPQVQVTSAILYFPT